MNRFKDIITSVAARPSTVVHLGAGYCKEFDFYQSLGSERIVFVEPDPQCIEKAGKKFNNSPNVTVIQRGIASKKGKRLLNITNNRRFSSLLSPAGLLDFYPNIAITHRVEIETITLTELCHDLAIDDKSNNLLVSELQGLEVELLPLIAKNTLHNFKWLLIRSSTQPLYQSNSKSVHQDPVQVMRDTGFTVLVLHEDTPPFINILCIRNDAQRKIARFKAEKAKLSKKVNVLKQSLTSKGTELVTLKTQHSKQTEVLVVAAKTSAATLKETQTQVTLLAKENGDLLQQIENLKEAVNSISDKLEEANAKVTKLAEEKVELLLQIKNLEDTTQTRIIAFEKAQSQLALLAEAKIQYLQQLKDQEIVTKETAIKLDTTKTQVTLLAKENRDLLQQIENLKEAVDSISDKLEEPKAQVAKLAVEKIKLSQQIDSLKVVSEKNSNELQSANTKVAELENEKDQQLQQIEDLKVAAFRRNHELQTANAKAAELADEKDQQLQQLEKLKAAAEKSSNDLQTANAKAAKLADEKQTQLQQIETLKKTASTKTNEMKKANAELVSITKSQEKQALKITELRLSVNEKSKEIDNIQRTLLINNKLVLKSHADLKDLQTQYRNALQHQDEQHNLLCELKEQLGRAAKFYQQLNLQNLTLEGDTIDQNAAQKVKSLGSKDSSEDQ